jgi:hypothetical protein
MPSRLQGEKSPRQTRVVTKSKRRNERMTKERKKNSSLPASTNVKVLDKTNQEATEQ